jgi:hypothetical protein
MMLRTYVFHAVCGSTPFTTTTSRVASGNRMATTSFSVLVELSLGSHLREVVERVGVERRNEFAGVRVGERTQGASGHTGGVEPARESEDHHRTSQW